MMLISKIVCALTSLLFLIGSAGAQEAAGFSKVWNFGGNLSIHFQSDAPFEYTKNNELQISAHLPGYQERSEQAALPTLTINHHSSKDAVHLEQGADRIEFTSPWSNTLPPDFIHLLYGAARLAWLKQGIFPVHAACIGNDQGGYVLLMGNPGSGKTSLTLNSVLKQGYQVFSGDKTLLRFNENNQLEAIAGTHTITVRMEDVERWKAIPKVHEHLFGDRLAFQLAPEHYSQQSAVPIKQIFLVTLNDGVEVIQQLSPLSALHTLYPYFIDKQREDVLIEGGQAFLDGTVELKTRQELAKNLQQALENIPVFKAVASMDKVSSLISQRAIADTSTAPKKILFGICGISNGHCSRQLPVMKHLLEQGHQLMVFTYGDGLTYFNNRLPQGPQLTLVPVADPYFVGTPQGLDFAQTALSDKNQVDFNRINALAMQQAAEKFGRPDLVISDYEMVAAQYAYAKNAPLVTLDQQSKYLVGDFSLMLNGTSYIDEVERLGLFFPKAEKRIAVSFFQVPRTEKRNDIEVEVLSPMIRPEVLANKEHPLSNTPSILVYITAQQLGEQPVDKWVEAIKASLPESYDAHLFLPQRHQLPGDSSPLHFYHHGDSRFDDLLFAAHGIITTAGHNLLSEAMYLEKPVYAVPLPLYEQQLNAQVIEDGGFGMSRPMVAEADLKSFFTNLATYKTNIQQDQKYLLKEPGNQLILEKVDQLLRRS